MASSHNMPDYPDEIISMSMFHPDICCRQQAENYVLQHSRGDGSFLLRPNTDNDPSYISITTSFSGNKLCNAKVHIEKSSKGTMYFISDKLKFPSFNALLNYYFEHRIHCTQGIDNLRLLIPLRKINPTHVRENRKVSTTSLESDDSRRGTKPFKDPPVGKYKFNKKRAQSESQITLPMAISDVRNKPEASRQGNPNHQNLHIIRSKSETLFHNLPPPQVGNNNLNYANSRSIREDPKSMMQCRPPAPLPRPEVQPLDHSNYYSSIEATKDFFRETYEFLKENEQCECGLRLSDSELALGWTIHRSHDPATLNHIFFQHGDTTTWDMPVDLAYILNIKQLKFIAYLCQEGRQPLPFCLRERLDKEFGKR